MTMQTTKKTQVSYCRHGVPDFVMGHDCDYTDLRESLVPEAEKYADDHVGARPQMLKVPGGVSNYAYEAWVKAWNQCFLAHIDAEMKAMLARQETL